MNTTTKKPRNRTMPKASKEADFLRARQVAALLGVGLSTVWLWKKQGKLKAYKLSERVTVFKRDEIERVFKLKPDNKEVA